METERLIIRNFQNSDSDMLALFNIMSDIEVNRYLPWFPLKNKNEAVQFFNQRILPIYGNKCGYYLAICLKNDNKPIGYITVSNDDSHDFGYGLKREFWGQGIITEATKSVIKDLKKKGLQYITATHDVNNVSSGRVMQKLGMKYCYSYEEQWLPKNILVTFRMYQLNFDDSNHIYSKYCDQSQKCFVEKI